MRLVFLVMVLFCGEVLAYQGDAGPTNRDPVTIALSLGLFGLIYWKRNSISNFLFNNSFLKIPKEKWMSSLWLCIIFNVVGWLILKIGSKRCASCKSDWFHPVVESELVDRSVHQTTVKEISVATHKDASGKLMGTTSMPTSRAAVQVIETNLKTYQCISCGANFKLLETSSVVH